MLHDAHDTPIIDLLAGRPARSRGLAFAARLEPTSSSASAGRSPAPTPTFGAQMRNGAEQAVADINAAGGVLGQKIARSRRRRLPIRSRRVSVADKFVGDRSHSSSATSIPASPCRPPRSMPKRQFLEITPASTNPQITERGMWNIFRTCGRDDQQGAVAGRISRAASRARRSPSSTTRRPTAKASPTRRRRRSTRAASPRCSTKASTRATRTIRRSSPRSRNRAPTSSIGAAYHTEGGLIVRQMRDQGVNAVLMGGDGIASDEFAVDRRPRRRGHA